MLAEEEEGMKAMMAKLKKYIRKKRFIVNIEKAKVMRFRKGGGKRKKINWRWEEKVIEKVKYFKYLGYIFQRNDRQEEQVKDEKEDDGVGTSLRNREKEVWRKLGKKDLVI